uniref:Uncharacterized protein n=1 Tax=Pseudomonas phage Ulina01 TaxID=3138549 RepID=A0AAU6W0R7_9CAUD
MSTANLAGLGGDKATVKYNKEYEEWVVKFWRAGVYQKAADYHTDDRQDAHSTAEHWLTAQDTARRQQSN